VLLDAAEGAEDNVTGTFYERVYALVCAIPRGKAVSYGQIALWAGRPRAARAVGYALHRNPMPGSIPCHRVVFRNGAVTDGFVFGGPDEQRRRLEAEGVVFTADGRVDMGLCRWEGAAEPEP
jgi:methylated-DNA-protein-cysteine methyltransferase-like protein